MDSSIDQVEVFGPLKVLERLSTIQIPIDLANISSSQVITYTIPTDKEWKLVSPAKIQIDLRVGPTQQRRVSNIPIEVVGLAKGYELQFIDPANGRVALDLLGSRERVEQVRLNQIIPSIDVSQLTPGEHTVEISFALPEFIRAVQPVQTTRIVVRSIDARETSSEATEEENQEKQIEGE